MDSEDKERTFWLGIRKAMIEFIRAIEKRYALESALISHDQRNRLRRLETAGAAEGEDS